MPAVLYVVATPIGNLGDITLRAIETLRSVDRILAEDTRRTRGLLSHLGIAGKEVERFDEHATAQEIERVVERLVERAERVAVVTDAGTPLVSDPGAELVARALDRGVTVVSIPGPSAVVAALSVSGLAGGSFRFVGFLPKAGDARRVAVAGIAATEEPVVLFEAPSRVARTLADLARETPERPAAVVREITKVHEETVRGTLEALARDEREWMGEVTIVLGRRPETSKEGGLDEAAIDARIDEELAHGKRAKDVAEKLALETGKPRRELYARVIARKS